MRSSKLGEVTTPNSGSVLVEAWNKPLNKENIVDIVYQIIEMENRGEITEALWQPWQIVFPAVELIEKS